MAVISNYVPEEEITCYTLPETIDSEPKLPSALAQPVHKFIMMVMLFSIDILVKYNRHILIFLD